MSIKRQLLSVLIVNLFFAATQNSFAKNSSYSYLPYLQIGGTHFFKTNTSKAAFGFDIFVPIWQTSFSDKLIFTQIRGYDRTGKPFEGNLHLGYRYLNHERGHLYGIYGAFDRKRTEFGNYFSQLTFGVEGWFKKFFIGGNLYQPIGDRSKFTGVIYEKALNGGDLEIGYEFLEGLIGYAGGYYFKTKDIDAIYGPKARLTYDWSLKSGKKILGIFDKFGLEVGVQRDTPRGIRYYLSANFRVGLWPKRGAKLEGTARHMVDLVRRDIDIVNFHRYRENGFRSSTRRSLNLEEGNSDTKSRGWLNRTVRSALHYTACHATPSPIHGPDCR